MTKEITKSYILQQIEDKFKLREFVPEKFTFSENVIPIYNIEQHLGTWEIINSTVTITSADAFILYTVPDDERWFLRAYLVIYGFTGAIAGSGMFITNRPTSLYSMYLDLKKGQDVSYLVELNNPVVLQPGNTLRYLIDTYVSTQDLSVRIDILKEKIR